MALFFDINKLERRSNGDYVTMVQLLEVYYLGYIPRSVPSKISRISIAGLRGPSFLLNPIELFNSVADMAHKAQYIRLAALRSFFIYKIHRFTGLDLSLYPDVSLKLISNNPLLYLTDNNSKLNFKYEDK